MSYEKCLIFAILDQIEEVASNNRREFVFDKLQNLFLLNYTLAPEGGEEIIGIDGKRWYRSHYAAKHVFNFTLHFIWKREKWF